MTVETKDRPVFPRGKLKTYGLMELVRGTSPMVGKGPDESVFAFPVVAILEGLLALGTTALLLLFSLLRDAPLEELANPDLTTNPAKAPWYFMSLQELLLHMHPMLAGIIVPALVVLFLLALPYLDTDRSDSGRWFASARGSKIVILAALYALIVQPALIVFDELVGLRGLGVHTPFILQAVGPIVFGVFLLGLPLLVLWRFKPNRREVMMLVFTVIMVSAVVLTVSGFLFRGPGMHLYSPWNMPAGYNPWSSL
ncbi:MAG: menaquinol-cytochrome C reductase [Anaerolineae bacterium]